MCELVKPLGIKVELGDPVKKKKKRENEVDISVVSARVCPETRCSSLTQLEMTNQLHQHKQNQGGEKGPLRWMLFHTRKHHQNLHKDGDFTTLQIIIIQVSCAYKRNSVVGSASSMQGSTCAHLCPCLGPIK